LARRLLHSLNHEQQQKAVFREQAYGDIVTGSAEMVSSLKQVGIAAAALDGAQMDILTRLIDEYVSALTPEIARQRTEAIRNSGLNQIHFVEYDNVQNGANHIHTVWRDFDGDFGRDLLREHYRQAHL